MKLIKLFFKIIYPTLTPFKSALVLDLSYLITLFFLYKTLFFVIKYLLLYTVIWALFLLLKKLVSISFKLSGRKLSQYINKNSLFNLSIQLKSLSLVWASGSITEKIVLTPYFFPFPTWSSIISLLYPERIITFSIPSDER